MRTHGHLLTTTFITLLAGAACDSPSGNGSTPTTSAADTAAADSAPTDIEVPSDVDETTAAPDTATSDTTAADTTIADTTVPDTMTSESDGEDVGPQPACDFEGFTTADAALEVGDEFALYFAQLANGDNLQVELLAYAEYDGATGPGTYPLTGENYETCANCVTAGRNCDDDGCVEVYLASAGSLIITRWDDTRFEGRLEGLVLKQVEIDSETFHSTEIPDGNTWCMDSLSFSEAIESEVVEHDYTLATSTTTTTPTDTSVLNEYTSACQTGRVAVGVSAKELFDGSRDQYKVWQLATRCADLESDGVGSLTSDGVAISGGSGGTRVTSQCGSDELMVGIDYGINKDDGIGGAGAVCAPIESWVDRDQSPETDSAIVDIGETGDGTLVCPRGSTVVAIKGWALVVPQSDSPIQALQAVCAEVLDD